jgi:hypothetical protein
MNTVSAAYLFVNSVKRKTVAKNTRKVKAVVKTALKSNVAFNANSYNPVFVNFHNPKRLILFKF